MSIFREHAGKASMTRTLAFALVFDATVFTIAAAVYLVRGKPEASVVTACAAVLGALVASGCVALASRSKGGTPDSTK